MSSELHNSRKWLITGALVVGAALGAYGIAGAATTPTTRAPSTGRFHSNEAPAHEKSESAQREADENAGRIGGPGGPGNFGGHGNETMVTGATADKIKAAALAAVPGTVTKTEQRADGTYEAEITKADGSEVHVSLDKSFAVTSTNSGCPHGPGNGGPGTGAAGAAFGV